MNVASSEWEIKPFVICDLLGTTFRRRGYSEHVAPPPGLLNRPVKELQRLRSDKWKLQRSKRS